jgi:DNA-binding MarR family transcriptional regulator
MTSSLKEELRQNKPFTSLEEEALLSIVRTSAVLMDSVELLLRPYGITATQYNVLRILRGSEPDGLGRNDLRDRMLTRMPDVTRLLDRMEAAGLVERVRGEEDRRMVTTRITKSALRLLANLDPVVVSDQKRRFEGAAERDLRSLIDTLALLRSHSRP